MSKQSEADFLAMLPEGTRFYCLICTNTIKPSNYSEHKKICSKGKKKLIAIKDTKENVRESHERANLNSPQTIGLPTTKMTKKNKSENLKGNITEQTTPKTEEPKPTKLTKGQYLIASFEARFSWKFKAKFAVLTDKEGKKFLTFSRAVAGALSSLDEELKAMIPKDGVMALDIDGDETEITDKVSGEKKTIQYIFIKRLTIGETVYRVSKTYLNGNETYVLQVAKRDTEALAERLHPKSQESTIKPEVLAEAQVAESKAPVS
jgi:hypothetical protein